MGGDSGHVQVVGNDGTRYDQYGKNRFTPANFNWYVPPPGGSSVASAPTKNAPQAAMKPIGNGITLNTSTGEYYKNGTPTGHFRS
jgi:hypothetical protein